MKKFIPLLLLLAAFPVLAASGGSIYEKPAPVRIVSEIDRALAKDWEQNGIAVPAEASDAVMVRRLHLGLAGRLPTPKEARDYIASTAPDKREQLIDRLLASDGFADYWAMHWSDALRVKSEFPINLWPNAVYGYHRRIRKFLADNEPYNHFARALLTAEGSNFRTPEANFYRATADRSAAGIAAVVVQTFLGGRFEALPEAERKLWTDRFAPVRFKKTKEWKEEIVYWDIDPSGADSRGPVADAVLSHPEFSRTAVNRAWGWLFGRGLRPENDGELPVNPPLLDALAAEFERSGYDFRALCRNIVNSAAYRAAPFGESPEADLHFAAFPVQRLDAEVLDDAISDLSGIPSRYSSVIPEPFTYLPPEQRSVDIADGSITSSFLILFGRPARDSGLLSERNNSVTASQRLQLFNSGELYRKLGRIAQREEMKKLPMPKRIEELYWLFYSRPPTAGETRTLLDFFDRLPKGREKWTFPQEICWILVNSREFLYQH
mgnify:CR=1 FL=1